ncbi:hypothetical protein NDN13_01295 [Acinetobacter sp. C32I]|uniref:hypothetical protein n=1 Tax=Acinetobacter sp. C32I TaxID=2950074 RepID=UPI002037573F|nr:hypothetical protein [Acinetobacter sp. C32I]USA53855.1 hypothetical protein NDN13_01295 [Acinetobacter sp. C32I]
MKVKDLISELQNLDQDLELYFLTEDEEVTKGKKLVEVFGFKDVHTSSVTTKRNLDSSFEFTFFPEENGREVAFINFTKHV